MANYYHRKDESSNRGQVFNEGYNYGPYYPQQNGYGGCLPTCPQQNQYWWCYCNTGPTGPVGPTGPAGSSTQIGISYQFTKGRKLEINDGYVIIYDKLVNKINDLIAYNQDTGTFIFTIPGHYYITFWVNVASATSDSDFNFDFAGATPVISAAGAGSKSGTPSSLVIGQGIVDIKAGDSAAVVYRSKSEVEDTILFADTPDQSYITIFYIGQQVYI